MCLSSVYDIAGGGEKLICDRIINVSVENSTIKFTNLLGIQTVVEGELKSIDMNNNVIRILAKQ